MRRWLGRSGTANAASRPAPRAGGKKLARLPLTFSDPLGQPVRLHAASVLTYADVARFSGGYLVLRRRPIITALAREAAVARHVQLIKQE